MRREDVKKGMKVVATDSLINKNHMLFSIYSKIGTIEALDLKNGLCFVIFPRDLSLPENKDANGDFYSYIPFATFWVSLRKVREYK